MSNVNQIIDQVLNVETVKLSPSYRELKVFLAYLRKTYLSEKARFPPHSWARPNYDSCCRRNFNWSNNIAESLHAMLKRLVNNIK